MLSKEILSAVPLFAELSDSEIGLLADSCRRVSYPPKSIVFQEGDSGDFLLIVLRGRVKVTLLGDRGEETIVSILEAPAFLGEMALLDDAPRSATVMTLVKSEFLQMNRGPFRTLLSEHPAIALKVMSRLAGALRDANEQIRTLSMFDAYGRIIRCLLGIARKRGQTDGARLIIRPKPSFQEVARMIGCSRETVSRGVKTLQQAGYVSAVDRGLALEPRAIRRYLEPALQNFQVPPDTTVPPARRKVR
jgi:CRP-like cAMP-binding protein